MQTLCDREDNSSKKFISSRFTQKDTKNRYTNHDTSSVQQKTVDLTDLSSENSSYTNKSLSVSCNRDKQSKRNQKVKSTRDSSSRLEQKISKSVVKEKDTSRRYKISSDSNESTDSSSKVITQTRNIKFEKMKRKTNSNRVYSSDSESDEKDITRALSISKRMSKDTRQQNKKMGNSCNAKSKEYYDSTSESEDEVYKRRNRGKNSETSRMTPHSSKDERKCDKSLTGLSNVQNSDSDNSSSKEFQKIKLQKVNRNKYSTRQLVDLEIDYTKSPSIKNSTDDESEKHINEQSNRNFNDIKQILRDCKKICSNFQMYIESIEQLYSKTDKKRFILKSTEKLDKLRTMLEEKQKDLKTFYKLWSRNRKKSATKRSYKIVSSDESSEEYEKRMVGNKDKYISSDERDGKAVSECDSEEIFSANETSTLQMQKTQHKADTLRTKNNVNNNQTNTDDEDRMSTDESRNNDKSMDMREDLTSSPVLGTGDTLKEKKTNSERSHKKQLFFERNKNNNKIQLTKENTNDKQASLCTDIYNDETEIEDSLSKDNEEDTLGDYTVTKSNKKSIINESMDMFDTSLEDAGKNKTEVEIEINCDKAELSYTPKDKFLERKSLCLQDKVPSEEDNQISTSLLSCNVERKKKLLSQNNQEKITSVTDEDNSKASGKINSDDNESLDDAEALAKKGLLTTDFDDTFDILPNGTVVKLTEDLITKDINLTEKKNEMEDNDSDVNSVSTVMLSTFIKEANTKVEKESDGRLDKRSYKEISSSSEDTKTEKVAEKDFFKLHSDDSTLLLSESGKLTNKKSGSDPGKNVKAKLSMSGSSNESFSPELVLSETTNTSKSVKRNHEPESEDGESTVDRLRKKRFKLNKNHYYKNDKKLRMSCKVYLTRLSAEILKRHSRALRKSREYLEHRALKRYREFFIKRISVVLHRLT